MLHYLATVGKKRVWQNPHRLGQVVAFASSLGAGSIEDFVGDKAVNCRTCNEPQSHFGLDLGNDRRILPSCYTIRNRNAKTHVLLNWQFEGSNDRSTWVRLDKRIYYTGDPDKDVMFTNEQNLLK